MFSGYLQRLTRLRLLVGWFGIIAFSAALTIVLRGAPTLTTLATIFALSLVPAAIMMILWPGAQPLTAGEVIRGERRR
jgi:hypothetical protein